MELLAFFHTIFQILGIGATFAGFILPRFTAIREIERDQTVGQRSSVLYVASCMNFVLWVLFPKASGVMIFVNICGVGMMMYTLCKFLQYCQGELFQWNLVCPVVAFISTLCIVALYMADRERNAMFMCWVCAISRGFLGVVPYIVLVVTRTMRSMPSLLLSVVALVNSMVWIGFSLTFPKTDGFILWPSIVGAVSAAILVALHIRHRHMGDLVQPQLAHMD